MQRIAAAQLVDQRLGKALDHGHFEAEPPVPQHGRENPARLQEAGRAPGQVPDHGEEGRGGARPPKVLDPRSMGGHRVLGKIDAVDLAVILAAILEVVDHLERRAKRIVGGPGRAVLAVHVQHVAADRHRRERAVMHEIRPVAGARLAGIEPESVEELLSVDRRKVPLGKDPPQGLGLGVGRARAEERRLQPVEKAQLLVGREGGMVGDVVGRSHKAVEGEDRPAVAGMDQARGDREILVPVALAGFRRAGIQGHARYPAASNQPIASASPSA